jgi:hypothetical protein
LAIAKLFAILPGCVSSIPEKSAPESGDVVELPLRGWQVDCCCVDDAFRFLFLYGPDGSSELDRFELALRGTVRLLSAEGDAPTFVEPQGPRDQLGPLLGLIDSKVSAAAAAPDGTLYVAFNNSARLIVAADELLDAWSLIGPRSEQLVCLPGGDGVVSFGGVAVAFGRGQTRP